MKTKFKNFFINIFRKWSTVLIICLVFIIFNMNSDNGKTNVIFENDTTSDFKLADAHLKSIFPQCEFFVNGKTLSDLSEVYDKSENLIGYFFQSSPYCDDIIGYAGPVPFIIGVDLEGRILAISLLDNSETPSVLDYIKDKGFYESLQGLTLKEAQTHRIDSVTGATMTTSAVIQSVQKRIALLAPEEHEGGMGVQPVFNITSGMVMLFVLIGLICFLFPALVRKYRFFYLIADIIVIGIVFNVFLSLDYFVNSIKNGFIFTRAIGIIALISLIIPLVSNKNFYCFYLCPYGLLQETITKFQKRKFVVSKKIINLLLKLRWVYLIVLLVVFFICNEMDLSKYEPFLFFNYRFVSFQMVVFGVFFLVVSCFVTRFWCRFICPTGRIMEFIQHPCGQSAKNILSRLAVILLLSGVIVFRLIAN